jgi:hypothetical protein
MILSIPLLLATHLQAQVAPYSAPGVTNPVAVPAGAVYHGRQRQTDLALPKVTGTVRIDGVLTDSAWQSAAVLTGFSQYAPVDGTAAVDSTDVMVMYTDHAIYFGIRAFEPHGAVHATMADRDRIGADDHVQLLIDTFNDRRRAYAFTVNPFGVQMDGMFTDQSGTDLNPDFQYESKGRVTESGYEVEVRIPFKSLRFQQTDSQQWGLNVLRGVQHSGHTQTWTPADRGAPSFLSQSGTLRDLRELKRGLVLDVNPVMTQRTTGAPDETTPADWRYRREDPEFGGNITWGLTTNLAVNATVNPDFSQVEADVGQVVFDPRQAISFPEKRPFFLEGSENFSVPNGLIYTRRIVSPEAAMKLSGKVGALTIGALSAIDDESVVPGSTDNPLYNVLRLRRDLGAQSTLGMVYTDRVHGDNYNRVAGIDTRLLLGSRYVFNGQLATSFTRNAAGQSEWRPLFDFGLTKTGRTSGFNLVLEGVHPDFVTQSGFISRADVAHFNFTPRKTWFPQNSIFESISFSPVFDHTWEWNRFRRGTEPNDMKMNTSTNATLRGGWRATFYTWTETFKYPWYLYTNYYVERRDDLGAIIDTVPYSGTDRLTNIGVMTSVGTPQWRNFSGSAELVGGQDDNFDEWSSAWILYSTLNAEWRPTDRIRLSGRYIEQRTHRKSDGSLVRLRAIPRIKLEYQMARPLFVRFVGQHDATSIDALRDDSRTEAPVLFRQSDGTFVQSTRIERGGFRADWLVSYQPNPGTVLFAGYGTSLGSDEFFKPSDLVRTSDGFFLKLSYLFRL